MTAKGYCKGDPILDPESPPSCYGKPKKRRRRMIWIDDELGDSLIADNVWELVQALRRLDDGQGIVARRNARLAVKLAQRKIRKNVDQHYPTIKRKSKTRRKRRTMREKARDLRRLGWVAVVSVGILKELAAAGIRTENVDDDSHEHLPYAPAWAVLIAERVYRQRLPAQRLKDAHRSPRERRAIMVELGLLQDGRSP